jgi:O-antigen ligase
LRKRLGVITIVLLLAAVPLVQLGPEKLADRYSKSFESWSAEGGRLAVWPDTLSMGAAYPLFGTGFGTFSAAYPVYRSPEVRKFYKHVHNDYIQAFAEGGIAGVMFAALLLISVIASITGAFRGAKGGLAVGLAAALSLFMLHSLISFNLHIPANAAVAALLAGALQGLPWKNGT